MIKRPLKKYEYPPDKTAMATNLVLEQAEALSSKWTEEDEISPYTTNTESANLAVAEKKEKYESGKKHG